MGEIGRIITWCKHCYSVIECESRKDNSKEDINKYEECDSFLNKRKKYRYLEEPENVQQKDD